MKILSRSLPILLSLFFLPGCGESATAGAESAGSGTTATEITASELVEPLDRASYAIGVNVGRNLERDGLEVNFDALIQGLRDGLAAGETKVSEADMREAMQTVQRETAAKRTEKMNAQAEINRVEGPKYLEANKSKEGVQVTDSGLQYRIVRQGDGPIPEPAARVKVDYRGTLIDGTVFDSSYDRGEPAVFPVNQVIPGWTEALKMMPVGSKWELAIPANLGYGANVPPGAKFGPDAVLLFEVELLEIVG